MAKYRLGLDLGSTSVGWAAYALDEQDEPAELLRAGSHIFSDSRDPQSKTSLKAERRAHRQPRRMRDRKLVRKKILMQRLIESGLMPEDEAERKKLECRDPYYLRKHALDKQLEPFEVGRAIFHLAQRRGFKSNRKTAGGEDGLIFKSIKAFEQKLTDEGARTAGEYLARRMASEYRADRLVRARRSGTTQEDLFDVLPNRKMVEAEFDMIWAKQAEYAPEFYSENHKNRLKKAIFCQRDLKPVDPGKCRYYPDEYRMPKALPLFQRFRILQDLNHLSWRDSNFKEVKLTQHKAARDAIFKELLKRKELKFEAILKILHKLNITDEDVSFNLEDEKRKSLKGDETAAVLSAKIDVKKPGIGQKWHAFSPEQQHEFISLLLDEKTDDDKAARRLREEFGLTEQEAENCLLLSLPRGYGSLSEKAARKIVPVLEDQGLSVAEAIKEEKLSDELTLLDGSSPRLPYYGAVLDGDVVNAAGGTKAEQHYGAIPNPTVHVGLNRVRAVVNDLIKEFGKPHQIVIELARDLPLGAEGKLEIEKTQKRNQDRNEKINDILKEYGIAHPSRNDRQKYQLWEELNPNNALDRRCVYTGRLIGITDLLSDTTEIEHLWPRQDTLDDSMANKTVCFKEANRYKGKRTPFDAFGKSRDGYNWQAIKARANALPKNKQKRFSEEPPKKDGFLERQLNDTRYVSKYTRKYLTAIVPENQIWVVTGQLTADLRHHLGMNALMRDHNQPEDEKPRKNRNDHRHHAIDAMVIALISRSLLQYVSTELQAERKDRSKLFSGMDLTPWEGFQEDARQALSKIVVSHRSREKDQGSLHNETAYGFETPYNENGASQVHYRVPVEKITTLKQIEKIKDKLIREELEEEVYYVQDDKDEVAQTISDYFQRKKIRRIKLSETLTVIPIRDKNGRIYKGYKGDGNAYMDIYSSPHLKKWQSEIISRFDANQPDFQPEWKQNFPDATHLMRLRINTMLRLTEAGEHQFYHVQRLSKGLIALTPHHEANADNRNRDKDDPFSLTYKTASSLQKADARLVHISPSGRYRIG